MDRLIVGAPAAANYLDALASRVAALCGDPEPSARDLPLYRIYAVLALAKGTRTTAKDVHDAWAAWQCGIDPAHRSLVPFEQLPPEVQALDAPYVRAIHAVSTSGTAPSTSEVPWAG